MGQRKNKLTKKQRKNLMDFNFYNEESFDFDDLPSNVTHSGEIHYTDFICSHCHIHENIPTHIVMDFEFRDGEQPGYIPAFTCEKCGYDMYPVYFKGFTGKIYEYKLKD